MLKMKIFYTCATILLLFGVVVSAHDDNYCPSKCTCKKATQRDQATYVKLRCGGKDKVRNLDELDLLNLASEIVYLNLSSNLLTAFYPKIQFVALQKLDLSKNQLTILQDDQFTELPNLRRLDISANSIKTIEPQAFSKLSGLERLKLSQNQIHSIALGTFDHLANLKQLDISNNPLTCDCSLLWLLEWSQNKSVKLISNPTCATPSFLKGILLRKLKVGNDIHCKSQALNNGLPLFEIKPNQNQVVFEGDSLRLTCAASSISDVYPTNSKIEWSWLDSDPKLYFPNVSIENQFIQSTGLISSSLSISELKRNQTGIWNCVFSSLQGKYSRGITVVVISDDTKYCPITSTTTNKGTYTWPRTVVNYTATIPCESLNVNYDYSDQKASYFCSEDGQWQDLNTSTCAYISETTKILEQFSKVNSSIMESAKHFRNYTANVKHFKDTMDIVFAVETMENYLKYLSMNQIGGVLMDVANNLLQLPKEYLMEADYEHGVGGKLVNVTEKLAGNAGISSTSQLHKSNIAAEIFPVKKTGFTGLKCTWFVNPDRKTDRLFSCIMSGQLDSSEMAGKTTEASITIPETLFRQLEGNDKINVLIAMHATNKLFPIDESDIFKKDIRTAVVGTKLVDVPLYNLSDPVYVMMRSPKDESLVPVWWNQEANSWSSDGCHLSHEYDSHVVFFCHNLGYYGLLQDLEEVKTTARFKLSHPAIYVGSFILFVSLLFAIVTYLLCYPSIQMPKKAKHSLINLWISISLLVFLYVFGIYQTENLRICEMVGMLLHYFTLSSLLWMCVAVNCMYKRLSKNDIIDLQDDELPSDRPIKKPILGLYFVGWGVAIIVCGISAAINIKDYASQDYCFLKTGPPLSALYIPFTILLMFLCIFFLLIRCVICNLDANAHLSEGTQATENVDLDLLEPNFPDARSVLSASTSEGEDPEHAPSAQLKAYVIFLFLYVATWLSCALATTPTNRFFWFENDLLSIIYAVLSTVLSAFTLFFYGVARSDVRGQWAQLNRWMKRFRSRNVSDTNPNVPQIPIIDVTVTSRSSSRSSHTKSHNSNIFKAAVDLNTFDDNASSKINNVNLLVLHRQQYRTSAIPNIIENPTNAADVFYNPHQSIVARKFFKRQKRNLKRNNLVARQCDSDSTSVLSELKQMKDIDRSIFGTNSKVNNTNIHVEHVRKQQKNPNLFSDSAEEYDDLHVQNLVRKHRARKRNNRPQAENIMRSVSQQCTLEYSSENVSDSILDKASPEKPAPVENVTIYVNPTSDVNLTKSRASSVSVSDLDELYQQIRRGPKVASITRNSPCLSDSEVNSYGCRQQLYRSDSNLETTV